MNISYYQEYKPLVECKDVYGVKLEPGLNVAYNKGGDIKKGVITEIVKFDWKISRGGHAPKVWWCLECKIKVKELHSDHISTIQNINSIIVI